MFYEVVPVGKVEALTYDFDEVLMPGQIVLVPLGRRMVPGVVVKKVAQPDFKTKTISRILYSKPLPRHLLATAQFIHEYYLAATGEAMGLMVPRGVEKQRRKRKTEQMFGIPSQLGLSSRQRDLKSCERHTQDSRQNRPSGEPVGVVWNIRPQDFKSFDAADEDRSQLTHNPIIPLNVAQKNALEGLLKAPGATKLLYGVTGSGKTNIYLKMAARALLERKSVVLLVPEIALTGQLVKVFSEVFGEKVVVMHSRQTEAERHLIFDSLLAAEKPLVVIGPRSALFAPVSDLGLIIIDEEHEGTYYQENSPKYSAIRVASFMASEADCPLILGSATPTVEDFYLPNRHNLVKMI